MRIMICEKCQAAPQFYPGEKRDKCPHCKGPLTGTGGKSKYRNRHTAALGLMFASKKEAERYVILKAMEAAGEIADLIVQPEYLLIVNGIQVGRYTGDFKYRAKDGWVLEDVKSPASRTEAYKLRKRLVEALFKIKITEV